MKDLPIGVRKLTLATSIRWFGWGIGEAFIPVFLLLFSGTFLETGLLAAVLDIAFFLALPLAGYFVDTARIRKVFLFALILYVFVGLGYFFAGLFSAIIFVILARAINGVGYAFDQTARQTYILRNVPKSEESRVFGHYDFVTNFWWVVAVVIGMLLVGYIPLYWHFFFIIPTTLIAIFILFNVEDRGVQKKPVSGKDAYLQMFRDMLHFNGGLKLLALLSFFLGVVSSIIYFFTPVIAYSAGKSLVESVGIVLVYTIPYLLGDYLGKVADKYKETIYPIVLVILALVVLGLVFVSDYYLILVIVFLASIGFELFYLASYGTIARLSERTHLGEVDGSLNGLASLGAVVGTILFGLSIDLFGVQPSYSFVLVLVLLLLILMILKKKVFQR